MSRLTIGGRKFNNDEEIRLFLKDKLHVDKLTIDGKKFNSKQEIHQFLKDTFYFPDYYGMNADALWDMMTAWIEFPLTIEWINFHESLDKMGDDAEILLKLFRDAELEPLCKGFKFVLQYDENIKPTVKTSLVVIDGSSFENVHELYHYIIDELGIYGRLGVAPVKLREALLYKYDLPVIIEWMNFDESKKKLGNDADDMLKALKDAQNILKSFKVEVR